MGFTREINTNRRNVSLIVILISASLVLPASFSELIGSDVQLAKLTLPARYHVQIVRGESADHDAIQPIAFTQGDTEVEEVSLLEGDLASFEMAPDIKGADGIQCQILELIVTPPPERADGSIAMIVRGRFKLTATDESPAGQRKIEIRLPALLLWAKDHDYEVFPDPVFTIRTMVHANKFDLKLGDVPTDPSETIELEAAQTKKRNRAVTFNGTMLWVLGVSFTLIVVVIGWFVVRRQFSYS